MSDKKQTALEKEKDQNEVEIEITEETADSNGEEEVELTEAEKLVQRITELENTIVRKAAEFENYKKRTIRQFDDVVNSANDRIILEYLDVLDNFDRSFAHAKDDNDADAFKDGVKLIYNQMKSLVEKYNVKPIEALGKSFNPNFHEALMQVETDEHKEGIIATEIQSGYMIGERVLRHSKVGVSKPKPVEKKED